MKQKDALLERWDEILGRKGDAPAVFDTRREVVRTFREIETRAIAQAKLQTGEPHNISAIQIGNDFDWPSMFLACLRKKLVVLPIDESVSPEQARAALSLAAKSGSTNWGEKPPVLFKLTSGTTARPRLVRFRAEQLLADCDQICETMEILEADLNFGVIPISHSYGFSNLLTPLIARGVPMVLSRDPTPRAVLDDLARTNASVFPGTPVFYQAFCEMKDVPKLPRLRLCISAGAPLPLAAAKKFREKFGLTIHSFYGASECGGICYDREAKLEIEGFVGAPMNGVDLQSIDPGSQSSQVQVRSAAARDGYFPDEDGAKLGDGIFVPDDVLARAGDGFKIVGRVSDVINVAGKKVNPAEIEEVLRQFQGVRQVVAFGRESTVRNEEVVACVVPDRALDEKQLIEFCGKRLSAWQVPKRVFLVDSIPANERGKTSRKDLAKRFSL